jgi:hypothetical protein
VNFSWFDIGVAVVFGIIGYVMRELKYSRAAMLIGFVLGFSIEKNLYLAVQLTGPYFIFQPIPLGLMLFTLGFLIYNIRSLIREKKNKTALATQQSATDTGQGDKGKHKILEICFIAIVGIVMTTAFLQALTYDFIAARAPIVILVPLLILAGFHARQSYIAARDMNISAALMQIASGHNKTFNSVAKFCGWMIFLLILILVTGHYAGICVFMFILLNFTANERTSLSLSVAGGVTLFIYILFEQVLEMELYRGLIYRIWAGYSVF